MSTKLCTYCESDVPADAKTCPICAEPLTGETPSWYRPPGATSKPLQPPPDTTPIPDPLPATNSPEIQALPASPQAQASLPTEAADDPEMLDDNQVEAVEDSGANTQPLPASEGHDPPSAVPLPPPIPTAVPSSADTGGHSGQNIFDPGDVAGILNRCKQIEAENGALYGLFGRPSTGKSSFIYALKRHFVQGSDGFGRYTPEGREWDQLSTDLEQQWRRGIYKGTQRQLGFYTAINDKKQRLGLLDIAGEHFENVNSWDREIFDFFGLYLGHCKGLFLLVHLDEQAATSSGMGAAALKSSQMAKMIQFLTIAASIPKINSLEDLNQQRQAAMTAAQDGNLKLKIPVALCLTKADQMADMHFGPQLGRIVPGSDDPQSDPWQVVANIWPEHLKSLQALAPMLKVEWVSCLGTQFEQSKSFTRSVGLKSIFQHVVVNPPPHWALSASTYKKFRKLLRT